MSSAISQEILDHILDQLCFDRASLAASSLVAHRWLDTPRRHLFSVVRVSAKNVIAFAALLEEQRCTFRRHITGLEIDLVRGSQQWFVELSTRLQPLGITAQCTSMSLRGPQVRKEVQESLVRYYNNLEKFRVGPAKFDSVQDLTDVLGQLPHLRILDLQAAFTNSFTDLPSQSPASPLRELSLSSTSIHGVLPSLIDCGALEHVTLLSFTQVRAQDLPVIRRYLSIQNTTLEALDIAVYLPYLGVSDGPSLYLFNPWLRFLTTSIRYIC